MTDNGTLRDHLADVINERNEALRKIQQLEAQIYKLGITLIVASNCFTLRSSSLRSLMTSAR